MRSARRECTECAMWHGRLRARVKRGCSHNVVTFVHRIVPCKVHVTTLLTINTIPLPVSSIPKTAGPPSPMSTKLASGLVVFTSLNLTVSPFPCMCEAHAHLRPGRAPSRTPSAAATCGAILFSSGRDDRFPHVHLDAWVAVLLVMGIGGPACTLAITLATYPGCQSCVPCGQLLTEGGQQQTS